MMATRGLVATRWVKSSVERFLFYFQTTPRMSVSGLAASRRRLTALSWNGQRHALGEIGVLFSPQI